jgi:hypothetical protein
MLAGAWKAWEWGVGEPARGVSLCRNDILGLNWVTGDNSGCWTGQRRRVGNCWVAAVA